MKKDWLLYALFAIWVLSAFIALVAIFFFIGGIVDESFFTAATALAVFCFAFFGLDYAVTAITNRFGDEP